MRGGSVLAVIVGDSIGDVQICCGIGTGRSRIRRLFDCFCLAPRGQGFWDTLRQKSSTAHLQFEAFRFSSICSLSDQAIDLPVSFCKHVDLILWVFPSPQLRRLWTSSSEQINARKGCVYPDPRSHQTSIPDRSAASNIPIAKHYKYPLSPALALSMVQQRSASASYSPHVQSVPV